MDATTPQAELTPQRETTRALLTRLWREHVRHHKPRLFLVLALTVLMAGATALYPVIIDHAFQMFAERDRRILYQIPALVVAITSIKAAAQYFQNVQVQQIVLLVIRELQGRMFAHLVHADLARLEREAPAQLAARFTTDAADHPRGADPRGQRRRRCGDGRRADRLDAVSGLAAQPDRGGAVSAWPRCRSSASASACAAPRAACRRRMGEAAAHAERELRPGAHRARLSAGGDGDAPRRDGVRQLYRALMRMTKSRARVEPVLEVLGGVAVAAVLGFAGWRAAIGSTHSWQFHRLRRRAADRRAAAARARLVELGVAGGPGRPACACSP